MKLTKHKGYEIIVDGYGNFKTKLPNGDYLSSKTLEELKTIIDKHDKSKRTFKPIMVLSPDDRGPLKITSRVADKDNTYNTSYTYPEDTRSHRKGERRIKHSSIEKLSRDYESNDIVKSYLFYHVNEHNLELMEKIKMADQQKKELDIYITNRLKEFIEPVTLEYLKSLEE